MTTVAAMICKDGIVMGSDMKVVGGADIKWSANKLRTAMLGKSPLVIGGAGRLRHIQDAMEWMRIDDLKSLGENPSFDKFLDAVVEVEIPTFARDYYSKYGGELDLEMLIGCINTDKKPRLVDVYPDGNYDHITECVAIGSGSIFGEILLRKLYYPEVPVEFAKKLIGYIIWEIQGIDNNSGEDMQIICIGCDRKLYEVPPAEIEAYKELPKLIGKSYETIKKNLAFIKVEEITQAIEAMHKTIGKAKI